MQKLKTLWESGVCLVLIGCYAYAGSILCTVRNLSKPHTFHQIRHFFSSILPLCHLCFLSKCYRRVRPDSCKRHPEAGPMLYCKRLTTTHRCYQSVQRPTRVILSQPQDNPLVVINST